MTKFRVIFVHSLRRCSKLLLRSVISTIHMSHKIQNKTRPKHYKKMPSFTVKDAVAFVTGTNKPDGIGRAIVEALLSHGAAKVYATARNASELDSLVAQYHGTVVAVSLDVTDLASLAQLSTRYPDVNLVVNNAGYGAFTSSIQDVEKSLNEIKVN
jgi:3-oxoacyl-ACP reductase-like protein